jgi:hypothetical protein
MIASQSRGERKHNASAMLYETTVEFVPGFVSSPGTNRTTRAKAYEDFERLYAALKGRSTRCFNAAYAVPPAVAAQVFFSR